MAAKTNTAEKREPTMMLGAGDVRKLGNIVRAGLRTGTWLGDVAEFAKHSTLDKPTEADALLTANAIATAAGRGVRPHKKGEKRDPNAVFVSRLAICLLLPKQTLAVINELGDRATRENVLSALRLIRYSKGMSLTPAAAVKQLAKGKRVGARKPANPIASIVKALKKAMAGARGDKRAAIERAAKLLAEYA